MKKKLLPLIVLCFVLYFPVMAVSGKQACDTTTRAGLAVLEFEGSDNLTQELTVSPIGYCPPPYVFVSLQSGQFMPGVKELSARPFNGTDIHITLRLDAPYSGDIGVYWQVIPAS